MSIQHYVYQDKKEEKDSPDSVDSSIRRSDDYVKESKKRLIIAAGTAPKNIRTKRKAKTRKQK